jgi:hypothetical protein
MVGIRFGQSRADNPRVAAQEFYQSVARPYVSHVLFFCGNGYGLNVLASEFRCCFGDVCLVGRGSAGEIGPGGYRDRSLAGVSFSTEICQAAIGSIEDLHRFEITAGEALVKKLT